jgi:hypothetical protein
MSDSPDAVAAAAPAPPPAPDGEGSGRRPWRGPLLGLVALLAVLGAGFVLYNIQLYVDTDGLTALTNIRDTPAWNPPWRQSQISHLQGMGTQQAPVNYWIIPGYALLFAGTTTPLIVGSYLVFAGFLALAVFGFSRVLRLGWPLAIVAAQLACFLLFPPLEETAGLNMQLRLNPGVAYFAAVMLTALTCLLAIGPRPRASNLLLTLSLPALILYSILCDPIWTVVPSLSLALFFAVALAADADRRVALRRGAAAFFTLAVLLGLSVPSYLWLLLRYTARARFRTEILGEYQNYYYAYLPLQSSRAALLFAVLLAGTALALFSGERRVRLFAAACLAHMALLTGTAAVYLYTDLNWTLPLPTYFQLAGLLVYLPVSLAGWREGYARLRSRLPARPGRRARIPAAAVVLLVPAVALAVIALRAAREPGTVASLRRDYIEQGSLGNPIALERELPTRPGEPFRGNAVAIIPRHHLGPLYNPLWIAGVPTLEEYGQLVSPPYYYLLTRGLGKPEDGYSERNRARATAYRDRLLRALGVRFVWTVAGEAVPAPYGPPAPGADTRPGYVIIDLDNPNLGTYSPVRVTVSRSAAETVRLLLSPELAPDRDVVLTEPVAGPLTPARGAGMAFVDGGVRVTATSAGRSLLLLPLQYSHALRVRPSRGEATLVRANLAQTGLLFAGELDAFIHLDFGFASTRGRAQDLADVDALGIGEDGTRILDPAARDRLHPHARFRFSRSAPRP